MSVSLSIELVLAILLVTSFTSSGLLALWAAASPRHWFLRTAVVLAILSPLVFIPAEELFIAFLIQCVVVSAGVCGYRWYTARRRKLAHEGADNPNSQFSQFRFSLATLLLLSVLVAVATPIAIRLPTLDFASWGSIAVIGTGCGLAALLAAWMAVAKRKWLVWPIAIVCACAIGAIMWGLDWLSYAIINQFDWPVPDPASPVSFYVAGNTKSPILMWGSALPFIALLLTLLLLILGTGFGGQYAEEKYSLKSWHAPLSVFARATLGVLVLLLAAFPLYILWQLLHPLPIPNAQPPTPNGYDDLVAAGKVFNNNSPILNTTIEPASTAQLAAEVAKFASTYDRVRLALTRPCQAPVWQDHAARSLTSMALADIQSIRGVARALNREADLAQQQGRYRDAAEISIDNMRVGQASTRGGFVIEYLVGIAVEGIGQWSLYQALDHLDAPACRETVAWLERIDHDREPLDEVLHRDRIYDENANGWYGHLSALLSDIAYTRHQAHWAVKQSTARMATICRLLTMETALRNFHLEHGAFPDRLESLVPNYASAVPIDPYDADQRQLRYVLRNDGNLLYSVGFDGDDDGGRPSSRDEGWMDDGDMRLDEIHAPYDDGSATNSDQQTDMEKSSADDDNAEPAIEDASK